MKITRPVDYLFWINVSIILLSADMWYESKQIIISQGDMKYSEIQYNGCKSHFPNQQRRKVTRENWQHGSMGFSHVTCVSADVWRKEDLLVTMLKLLDKISPTECPKVGNKANCVLLYKVSNCTCIIL